MRTHTTSRVRRALQLAAAISVCAFAACRLDSPPQAPSMPAATTTPVSVTGSESIVWDQAAQDAARLARYQYIAYVDDVPADPVSASCGAGAVKGLFTCKIKLPKIQPGRHRLQLAVKETDNQKRESLRSSAILLDVAAQKTP